MRMLAVVRKVDGPSRPDLGALWSLASAGTVHPDTIDFSSMVCPEPAWF